MGFQFYYLSSVPKFNFKKTCFICVAIYSIEPDLKYLDHWRQKSVFCVKQLETLKNKDKKEENMHKEEGRKKSDLEDRKTLCTALRNWIHSLKVEQHIVSKFLLIIVTECECERFFHFTNVVYQLTSQISHISNHVVTQWWFYKTECLSNKCNLQNKFSKAE